MNITEKKTRKKHPNSQISKTTQCDTSQQQQRISTPQIRILEAKQLLISHQQPTKFKFRQKEIVQIEEGIKSLLNSKNTNQCKIIMVTGSPGSGKTLSVNSVLQKLDQNDLKIISLNSNMLKTKKDVQNILARQLSGIDNIEQQNMTIFKIANLLQKYQTKKCIIYIQQIELFFSCHAEYGSDNFFQIFCNKHLKILLLGISNTIDSLYKYKNKINININQIQNIVFHPYSIQQIKSIIIDKIQEVTKKTGIIIKFSQGLVKFVANKINQLKKGDMRTTFEFLKNLAKNIFDQSSKQIYNQVEVNIETVKKSLGFLNYQSPQILLTSLPFHQQMVLIAISNYLTQTQQISITQPQLKQKIKQIHTRLGIALKKQLQQQIQNLSDYNMIQIKSNNLYRGQKCYRYLLKIQTKDLKMCFQSHPVFGKFL